MDLILFFSVAAIFTILGDLYLCWQSKKYDAAAEDPAKPAAPASAEVKAEPELPASPAGERDLAETAPEEEKPDPAVEEQTSEAAPEEEAPAALAVEQVAAEAVKEEKAPETAEETKPKRVRKTLPLLAMRIIAAVLALPVAGILAVISHRTFGNSIEYSLKLLCALELLIPIGLLDMKYMKIPNNIILAGLVLFVGFFFFEWLFMHEKVLLLLKEAFFGLLLGGGVFLAVELISRSGLGAGDVKLFGWLGLMLTWRGVFNIIFFSILLIVIYAVALLIARKAKKDYRIPMGPFVTMAMIIAILLGL